MTDDAAAVVRLRNRIAKVVGGYGFVTISVSDARCILAKCDTVEMLDCIDALGGNIAVPLPEARGEA